MKNCPNCHAALDDHAAFCTVCGTMLNNGGMHQPPQRPIPAYDPYDHTAEYDARDISENKVFAMLVYLLGIIGVIVALLASATSPYVKFHLRQALKFTVVEVLSTIIMLVLCWTIIAPIVIGIFLAVLWVIKIICFFQICAGKAKEPAIIRSFAFLK